MTSKASFFDRAICRRSVRRTAPAWLLYTIYMLMLPIRLYSYCQRQSVYEEGFSAQLVRSILSLAPLNASIVAFVFGGLLAWALFHWLFRPASANFYASLPVRRETLFLTNYLTGLGLFAGPALVSSLLLGIIGSAYCPDAFGPAMQVFAATMLGALLFFSFGVLVCVIVGQLAAAPIVYLILNFAIYLLTSIISSLLRTFVYGMPDDQAELLTQRSRWASPVIGIWQSFTVNSLWTEQNGVQLELQPYLSGWASLCALALVGLVFALCAFLLFRRRALEHCGDVIAVRALRPVALYAFTLGCALVLGALLIELVSGNTADHFWYVLLFLFLGAGIGYFGGRMLLQKTVHVFKSGWGGLGLCCLALLLSFGAARLDLFGYSSYLPQRGQIDSVGLTTSQYDLYLAQQPGFVDEVLQLHSDIIDARQEQSQRHEDFRLGEDHTQTIYFTYHLRSGKRVVRSYELVYTESEQSQPESLISQFLALYNSPVCVRLRTGLSTQRTAADVISCYVSSSDTGEALWLGAQDAWRLYQACGQDIDAGLLHGDDVSGKGSEDGNYTPLSLVFQVASATVPGETEQLSVMAVPITATSLVSALRELGFDPYWHIEP